MRIIIAIFLAASVSTYAASPCEDSQYQVLKGRSVSTLTEIEMTYLLEYDRKCSEYAAAIVDSVQREDSAARIKRGAAIGVFLGSIAIIAAIVVPVIAANRRVEEIQDSY